MMATNKAIKLDGLTDREAAMDALLRCIYGIDDNDPQLIHTAFTTDAEFDLTPLNKHGMKFPRTCGRDAIVEQMMNSVGKMDTGHCVTNWRVQVKGDTAELTAYALAQHFPQGEGPDMTKNTYALMCVRYEATIIRAEEGLWRIKRFSIDNQWSQGDPTMLAQ